MSSLSEQRLLHLSSIDSTNSEAQRRFQQGERGPLWIWADEQTGGRGRLGRHWISKPGNLYVTYLFESGAPATAAAQLGFVAALAVHDAARALLPKADLMLKWPNDVLLGGAKLCGLLAEVLQPVPLTLAIGCGINVAHSPEGLAYPTTCLGQGLTPQAVLSQLQTALLARIAEWDEGRGFEHIRSAWQSRAMLPGTAIAVDGVDGSFAGLSATGALLFRPRGQAVREVQAGDVQIAALEAHHES